MIVTAEEAGFRLVTQADHARLAAEMLRLVVLPELTGHPRRALLLDAVARHDDGWWEWDAAPRVDPATGWPLDFRALAPTEREEIWRAGVERHAERASYTAALAAAHLLHFARRPGSTLVSAPFAAALGARCEELAEAATLSPADLEADRRWLALADGLSLAAATGEAVFLEGTGIAGRLSATATETTLELAPLPLAGATRFELSARRIERRRFASDRDLGITLASARWRRYPVRLCSRSNDTPG